MQADDDFSDAVLVFPKTMTSIIPTSIFHHFLMHSMFGAILCSFHKFILMFSHFRVSVLFQHPFFF